MTINKNSSGVSLLGSAAKEIVVKGDVTVSKLKSVAALKVGSLFTNITKQISSKHQYEEGPDD